MNDIHPERNAMTHDPLIGMHGHVIDADGGTIRRAFRIVSRVPGTSFYLAEVCCLEGHPICPVLCSVEWLARDRLMPPEDPDAHWVELYADRDEWIEVGLSQIAEDRAQAALMVENMGAMSSLQKAFTKGTP